MMTQARSALVIAVVTFLEAIRNRILLVTLGFAVALVGLSVAVAAVSLGERARLIVDIGLATVSAAGSLIAVALMISSFGRELSAHTAYPVLTRPIGRPAFVLGKYLGVLMTMLVVATLMFAAIALTVTLYGERLPSVFFPSLALSYLEMAMVTAVALLFSSSFGPVLAAMFCLGLLIAGNLTADIAMLADKVAATSPWLGLLLRGLYAALPDLQALSLRTEAANYLSAPSGFVTTGAIYAIAYATALISLSMISFSRRRAL